MKSPKHFNFLYTILMGAANLAFFYQLLATYNVTSFGVKGLFIILIVATFTSYIYSLGYIGGKKGNGFGYSKNTNVKLIFLVLLGFIVEFETWLYFSDYKYVMIYVYIQIFAVFLIALIFGILNKQRTMGYHKSIN